VAAHPDDRAGLELTGDLDLTAARAVRERLRERCREDHDVVVDVHDVSFADLAGCRALVEAAQELPADRRLVLLNPPPPMMRVLTLCGWLDDPRLVAEAA
jgi:anti-anti-sigma factor